MELKDLKKKSISDLHKLLAQSRDKLRDLRFKDANKQLKNVREVRETRNLIARILTLLNAGKTTQEGKNTVVETSPKEGAGKEDPSDVKK